MSNQLTHFAIYADDTERAKQFYSKTFGWSFHGYGQADFYQIEKGKDSKTNLRGALQNRSYCPVPDKIGGFECSISVTDIDEVIEKIKANKGKIVMPKSEIPNVGHVIKFLDTEANLVCAIKYFK